MDYPKRLIEIDLPIKRISAHARREKRICDPARLGWKPLAKIHHHHLDAMQIAEAAREGKLVVYG